VKKCPKCNKINKNGEARFCKSCKAELVSTNHFKTKNADDTILTLYFSGTGNTKYIAQSFSRKMDSKCLSIEADISFSDEIKRHNIIAFCYPIYGSRVPRIMREFVSAHMDELTGKKIIIFATQFMFSGDGARAFSDMFKQSEPEIIYAEHFSMPNNICNFPLLKKPSKKKVRRHLVKSETKIEKVCRNLKEGIIVKRGFSRLSRMLGNTQGKTWQGNNNTGFEHKAKSGVKIAKNCTACNLCVSICPMKNLENIKNKIKPKDNCTVCYRCVNRCPRKAITVMMFHKKPKWQYNLKSQNT